MPKQEARPIIETVSREPIAGIDLNLIHGDVGTPVRFEVSKEAKWVNELEKAREVKNVLETGGRVFITENDDLLFVDPPKDPSSI